MLQFSYCLNVFFKDGKHEQRKEVISMSNYETLALSHKVFKTIQLWPVRLLLIICLFIGKA